MSTVVDKLEVSAYTIPTDRPESDGTLEWKETTMILVRLRCGDREGLGYTYGDPAILTFIHASLGPIVIGRDVMDVMAIQTAMVRHIRNNGQCGLAMMAVSAVDIACWDLKAKLLNLPLCRLLGQEHSAMHSYASGGFTSYTDKELRDQLTHWAELGFDAVKIKIGRDLAADGRRIAEARKAIGEKPALYVDANGAYTPQQAVAQAISFANYGVDWFEEPVPARSIEQLSFIRQQLGGAMRIVVGEYGYMLNDLRSLLEARVVDVLQADATRCGGITGFLKAGHLCEAFRIPLSSHCAPAVHLHAALSLASFSIAEYFHDHVRIEQEFFEGVTVPFNGDLFPDLSRAGMGLVFRERSAEPYRVA